jgi:hypothetical protein
MSDNIQRCVERQNDSSKGTSSMLEEEEEEEEFPYKVKLSESVSIPRVP